MQLDSPRFFFNTQEYDNVVGVLGAFPRGTLASPTRSTVPLLSLIKDDWPLMQRILAHCGMTGSPSVHLEYEVSPPGSIGNPSQTDAMIRTETSAFAVEAKWTEPRYESVAKRIETRVAQLLKKDPSQQRALLEADQRKNVESWLNLLKPYSTGGITIETASDVVYQMIHRSASACATSPSPTLIYLHFEHNLRSGTASSSHYREDLESLYRLLGRPTGFPFYLVEVPLTPTVAFDAIRDLKKRTSDTDVKVRAALASSTLFTFGEPQLQKIT